MSTPDAPHARGKRSPVTCELKCGNTCAHPPSNPRTNDYFPDVVARTLSRRRVLAALGIGVLAFTVPDAVRSATSEALTPSPGSPGPPVGGIPGDQAATGPGLDFTPIDPVPADVDELIVPTGWAWTTIVRWGDPLFASGAAFELLRQSQAGQEAQVGYNCDYLAILRLPDNERRALAVINHEYTNEGLMFPPTDDPARINENRRVAMAAHCLTVVELEREGPGMPWAYVRGADLNRRIHQRTPFTVDGPAAGDPLLQTGDDPTGRQILGTLGNCAGGVTPWGTVLSGEENFHPYFVADRSTEADRYGIPHDAGGRAWWNVDPRFDARQPGYENEINRFGWVVEVDPHDPQAAPVKHTALGRFKHECASLRVAPDRRIIAYSGDDEPFEYIYKFVSRQPMSNGTGPADRAHNRTLLSDGDLYVARLTGNSPPEQIDESGDRPADGVFDGTGQWLPLVQDGQSRIEGMSVAEVLVHTRIAADRAGATMMDRPEDIEASPLTGKVYVSLTNNANRGRSDYAPVDEANPRDRNRTGHVLEIIEADDPTQESFSWNLLLVCGDPEDADTYFGGYTGPVAPISCPDNLAFDSTGTLWIATDGAPKTLELNDALHRVTVDGADRGRVEQFLAVPVAAETCGPVIDDRDGIVFISVQHPGEEGSWDDPDSYFPDYLDQGELRDGAWGGPRPSVVQIHRA